GPTKPRVVPVRLSKKMLASSRPEYSETPDPVWRGMKVEHTTAIPMFGFRVGDLDLDGCVAVSAVEYDSPAWKAGLRPGNFINHVDGKRVTTPSEFFVAVASQKQAVRVQITSGAPAEAIRTVQAP